MRDRIATALQAAAGVGFAAAGWTVSTTVGLVVTSLVLGVAGFLLGILDRRES